MLTGCTSASASSCAGLYWNTTTLASGLNGSTPMAAPFSKRGEFMRWLSWLLRRDNLVGLTRRVVAQKPRANATFHELLKMVSLVIQTRVTTLMAIGSERAQVVRRFLPA